MERIEPMPPGDSRHTRQRLARIRQFEKDFEAACRKHRINAAFVLVKHVDEKGSLLMVGGSSDLSDLLERAVYRESVEAGEEKH